MRNLGDRLLAGYVNIPWTRQKGNAIFGVQGVTRNEEIPKYLQQRNKKFTSPLKHHPPFNKGAPVSRKNVIFYVSLPCHSTTAFSSPAGSLSHCNFQFSQLRRAPRRGGGFRWFASVLSIDQNDDVSSIKANIN